MIYAGLIALFIVQRTNSRLDEFLIDPSSALVAFIIKRIVSSIFLSLSFSRSKIRANYEETRASHDQSRKGSTSNGNPLFLDSPPLLVLSSLPLSWIESTLEVIDSRGSSSATSNQRHILERLCSRRCEISTTAKDFPIDSR